MKNSFPGRSISIERTTRETSISALLDIDGGPISMATGLPFFDHLLTSMAFHGRFGLTISASGDTEVDPHHLVEDTGIVAGEAFYRWTEQFGPVERFGRSVVPMDEALSEVTVDASGRAYLVYKADYPQDFSGTFQMALVREFLHGFTGAAKITLHGICRYGENSHHMAESLFKAMGRALREAYRSKEDGAVLSTKGTL